MRQFDFSGHFDGKPRRESFQADDPRIEHCRNLRIESVKIEFLLAQERIAPFWQTATLFSRPNENRVHSFRVAVCKRGGAWNAPKRRALPWEGYKVEPWIFTARLAGTINLEKCSRLVISRLLYVHNRLLQFSLFLCNLIISVHTAARYFM